MKERFFVHICHLVPSQRAAMTDLSFLISMPLLPRFVHFGRPLGNLLQPWEEVAKSYLHLHVDVL